MKLSELKEIIDVHMASEYTPKDVKVVVRVVRPHSIGALPTVDIQHANMGFDWDHGKFILTAESDLREINRDEIKQLRKKIDELGEEYTHLARLKAENHSLKEKLKHKRLTE
jgi:hypothetical protein